jgi:hypothetical protein
VLLQGDQRRNPLSVWIKIVRGLSDGCYSGMAAPGMTEPEASYGKVNGGHLGEAFKVRAGSG